MRAYAVPGSAHEAVTSGVRHECRAAYASDIPKRTKSERGEAGWPLCRTHGRKKRTGENLLDPESRPVPLVELCDEAGFPSEILSHGGLVTRVPVVDEEQVIDALVIRRNVG